MALKKGPTRRLPNSHGDGGEGAAAGKEQRQGRSSSGGGPRLGARLSPGGEGVAAAGDLPNSPTGVGDRGGRGEVAGDASRATWRRRPSAVEPPSVEVVAVEELVGGGAAHLRAGGQVGRDGAAGQRPRRWAATPAGPYCRLPAVAGRGGDGGRKKQRGV